MQRVYKSQPTSLGTTIVTFVCSLDKRADDFRVATFSEEWEPEEPQALPDGFYSAFQTFATQIARRACSGTTIYVFPRGEDLL